MILKNPPTLTWPVMSVVADSIMEASMPAGERAEQDEERR